MPLLTAEVAEAIRRAAHEGHPSLECSLDLGRTRHRITVSAEDWDWQGRRYPVPLSCKPRTIYFWDGDAFAPLARYGSALFKLVPTPFGAPTFEIDGIKMLPTAQDSPFADAERKVRLVAPAGRRILDTCGGLGYFAHWCVALGAVEVLSVEKHAEVLWLRAHNPWSPPSAPPLTLHAGDIAAILPTLPANGFDAVLHDPPRFGIAGELYAGEFYAGLARVLKRGGQLFHYTGTPNRLTSGRDVPAEVARRLQQAGFTTQRHGDGILALRR